MNYGVFSLNVSIDTKSRNLFRCCQVRTTSIERTIGIEYFDLHEVYVNKRWYVLILEWKKKETPLW